MCDALKAIGMSLGLLGGYTKYCCFLCLCVSRAKQHHYIAEGLLLQKIVIGEPTLTIERPSGFAWFIIIIIIIIAQPSASRNDKWTTLDTPKEA
ncbi:hypothetical protein EVAR_42904_1 [Eumeta japonica]|uniref:Uncharacterized protein n=1 Tax=Eumeta variegata TaxID=151549 RepID=A0A4C1WXB5_EUMVA|nr:hypothetical protein EVAR_42904_1 [Eumeta japonica]